MRTQPEIKALIKHEEWSKLNHGRQEEMDNLYDVIMTDDLIGTIKNKINTGSMILVFVPEEEVRYLTRKFVGTVMVVDMDCSQKEYDRCACNHLMLIGGDSPKFMPPNISREAIKKGTIHNGQMQVEYYDNFDELIERYIEVQEYCQITPMVLTDNY